MKILGIETSCDETSAAVVQDGREVLSNIVSSQIDIHQKFGGVVPEVASRRHVELILPVIEEALSTSNSTLSDIDAVAIINRPGLIGALIVGVSAAKSIAYSTGLPLVPVHHLEAHIYSNMLYGEEMQFPSVCLVVSGGHSDIILMSDHGKYEILARTVDDAAGEAFDKCARALGLGYPGGPIIDKLAKEGNPEAVKFPRSKVGDGLSFSFSGLKTAVIRFAQNNNENMSINDIAASFQQAVVDKLVDSTIEAAKLHGVNNIMVAGGVAANSCLQREMRDKAEKSNIRLLIPPPKFCTDNAAMVASAGYFAYKNGIRADLYLDCCASEPIGKYII
ncbi:MAG: tRNA (adenosine(37)-N6)-threonylcarbamoyltransferase complex transferase subunit TsaD [Armatimonadota bacterium]